VNIFPPFSSCCFQKLPFTPFVLPFFLKTDHFFQVPGHGGPHHVAGIPLISSVAAAVHPVVRFEMPNDRLGPVANTLVATKPGLVEARMASRSLARNGQTLHTPAPSAPLHGILSLVKSPVPGDLIDGPSGVGSGSCDASAHSMHIGNVFLIFRVREDDPLLIDSHGYLSSKLAVGAGLALFDWCARQGAPLGSDPAMGSLLQTRSGELLAGRQGCPSRGGIRRKPQAKRWTDEQEAHKADTRGETANIVKARY